VNYRARFTTVVLGACNKKFLDHDDQVRAHAPHAVLGSVADGKDLECV
jgi:hypothetical protein